MDGHHRLAAREPPVVTGPSIRRSPATALLLGSLLLDVGCCRPGLGRMEPFPADAIEAHVRARQASFGSGFTVVAAAPFVVVGDGAPGAVREEAGEVVALAARRLKERFFERDPAVIVDVLMLANDSSYDRYAGSFVGPPSTPYGYYSPCDQAIYVNMSLGAGTLVHEMVHAFMDANFPACPTWFNEGLGALYEQPDLTGAELRGRPNWRLPGLKGAIARGKTMPLAELLATGRRDFYDEKRAGLTYAMARYLCYYLQEKGLLQTYYRRFVADQAADPAGIETLKAVVGEKDLAAFQRRWEAETAAIPYP